MKSISRYDRETLVRITRLDKVKHLFIVSRRPYFLGTPGKRLHYNRMLVNCLLPNSSEIAQARC